MIDRCKTDNVVKTISENGEEEGETLEINIFKYEILKACLETILGEYSETEEIDLFTQKTLSPAFKIAFNTLIKNNILIEDEYE